jgi:hypothetical protein
MKNRKTQKYSVYVKKWQNLLNKTLYFRSIDYNSNL